MHPQRSEVRGHYMVWLLLGNTKISLRGGNGRLVSKDLEIFELRKYFICFGNSLFSELDLILSFLTEHPHFCAMCR